MLHARKNVSIAVDVISEIIDHIERQEKRSKDFLYFNNNSSQITILNDFYMICVNITRFEILINNFISSSQILLHLLKFL